MYVTQRTTIHELYEGTMIMIKTAVKRKPPKIYRPPRVARPSGDTSLTYWVQCPKCKGRAMDISDLPERPITLEYKCPCCHSFIDLSLVALTGAGKPAIP